MVLSPISANDRVQLATLLHTDVKQLQPPQPILPAMTLGTPPAPGNPPTAVSAAGQGGDQRKNAERLALALPYNPVGPQPHSSEVSRFFSNRKEPRPGTMQVILVLREATA